MQRLNIGCGKRKRKGYISIDIEPSNNPDIVGDFRTMDFKDVDEIRAEHLLEHFSRDEGIQVLKLWHKWLKDGGTLIVETPDFEGICRDFAVDKYWMTRHAYGSQEAEWAYHRDGYYEEKFKTLFPNIGFEILDIIKDRSRRILPNIKVVAIKHGIQHS
jgi:predicted SAM-dependent methyltransferase